MSTLHMMFHEPGTQLQTPLHRMRRQQLNNLARAWEIPLENAESKDDMLVPLTAAQKAGVFKTPPKHPEFYEKAMKDSDQTADESLGRKWSYGA